jgi:glycosyltransferase involved in cell wall biosynthesis
MPSEARERVVLTGYVAHGEKAALLHGALALVYPSLYEGFGLPVAEALACGTPVLTSNVSALPEVAGDAALLVEPEDVRALADGLQRLVEDEALRARLSKAGRTRAPLFTWEGTARKTAQALLSAGQDG